MKRVVILLPVLLALQVGVQPALAWTWPVDGPVLRPFTIANDPYGAGQHRGLDVGAAAGSVVRAPVGGTVSFAGTVPAGGRTVTIQTGNGYSVTLVHLGTIQAARSAVVSEGDAVGTVGPSGDPEHAGPYVHLGIRVTADPNGYVDPLGFLPARAGPAAEEPAPQPAPETRSGKEREPKSGPVHALTAEPSGARRAARSRTETPVRAKPTRERMERRPARLTEAPSTLPRDGLRSFERSVPRPSSARRVHVRTSSEGLFDPLLWSVAAALAALAGLALRRQLRDAGPAHGAASMFLEPTFSAAEDTSGVRLGQEDRLVMHRDLERVFLAEAEPLSDLDGDDDAPELVEVPDDPRRPPVGGWRCASRRLSRPHGGRSLTFLRGVHA
jgi:hypothetical protein